MKTLRLICIAGLFAAAAALAAPNASADYAVLRSGHTLHISGYLRQGANILLYVSGGEVIVAATDVIRFEPEDRFAPAPAPAESDSPFASQIRAAAAKNGLNPKLISSIISAESNFHPAAVSRRHAMGLMQLMPATAAQFSVRNPFDPAQNIAAGSLYLKQLLSKYHGSLLLALAAYNAGPQRVAQFGGVPPFRETRSYIRRVTAKLSGASLISSAPLPR